MSEKEFDISKLHPRLQKIIKRNSFKRHFSGSECIWVLGDGQIDLPFPDRERLRIARIVEQSSLGSFRADPIFYGYDDFAGLPSFKDDTSSIEDLRRLLYKDSKQLNRNILIMDRLVEVHGFRESSINGVYPEMNNEELIDYLSKVYKKQHNEDLPEYVKKKALKYLDFMFLRSRIIPILLIPDYELNLDDRCYPYVKDFYNQILVEKKK